MTDRNSNQHNITVCTGVKCYFKGAPALVKCLERELDIKAGETTADGRFTLMTSRCRGACGLAPVIQIDGDIYECVSPEEIPFILAKYR